MTLYRLSGFMKEKDSVTEGLEGEYEEEDSAPDEPLELSSFVCEDCDYRWEDSHSGEDWEEQSLVCPMCGSLNATQL